MTKDYIDILIDYAREYLLAESLRIVSTDYIQNALNFIVDPQSDNIKEVDETFKDQLLESLENEIEFSLDEIKGYLIKNDINSIEAYEKKTQDIKKFVDSIITKIISKIKLTRKE